MQLPELRQAVYEANMALPKTGLVKWTSGNASGRDPETNLVAIKPSGVLFDKLTPELLVLVDLHGNVVEGDLKPSVDTASHLYVYRHMPNVHGIAHTHSQYATAFAVQGQDLPVTTTTHACLFGGPIPCSGLATIGEEDIGREIVATAGDMEAVLMRNHGVFALGRTVSAALKNAVYVEESAESTFFASQLGGMPASLDAATIAEGRRMYLEDYGQVGATDK
ncbi:MAG: L-ribulose-5-phosphate 4-epimerase [Pseudomonadota bacterium]